ncbi:uncharacterized protein Dwil_GK22173 [Drosophila willistoni]|uniref:Essential protein Yae1 N-terminal domain-containing protein n=1 Tax=Drosophila willistoni TaxID=7260 RepID=B4MY83_DROWI|nr:protein LTO1 homolog [Drosophila willistoni]EDW77072.1 uncharacterized protein Dwil_GK22173 [Drosophila willistoni]
MSHSSDDINDLFDDIVLTEEKHARLGYNEGWSEGQAQGNSEGYKLGYAQGVQLGEELGSIYGEVVAHQQLPHTDKVKRSLQQLRLLIEQFPRTNDEKADIIGAVEVIRNTHRRLYAQLGTKNTKPIVSSSEKEEVKDYSF